MPKIILSLVLSYILGAIPFSYLIGKIFKSVDIRKHGSGNIGATNAFRVLGPFFGITALILDIGKGLICPTFIADSIAGASDIPWALSLRIILGLVAVIGHNWTIFLNFKGGKGVATSLGVIIGLAIIIAQLRIALYIIIFIWIIIFLTSGFVSLASIIAAVIFPIAIIILKAPLELIALSILLSLFITFRHKSNIYRLLHNKEHRFSPLKPLIKILLRR